MSRLTILYLAFDLADPIYQPIHVGLHYYLDLLGIYTC